MAIGVVIAFAGKAVLHAIPERAEHAVTAAFLLALGVYYLVPALRRGHGHAHSHSHSVDEAGTHVHSASNPTAIGALVMGLTLSPCLDLLPIYFAAAPLPWFAVGLICACMGVVTLTLMLLFVWLTLCGMQRMNLGWLEKNEGAAVGSILIAMGIALLLL